MSTHDEVSKDPFCESCTRIFVLQTSQFLINNIHIQYYQTREMTTVTTITASRGYWADSDL